MRRRRTRRMRARRRRRMSSRKRRGMWRRTRMGPCNMEEEPNSSYHPLERLATGAAEAEDSADVGGLRRGGRRHGGAARGGGRPRGPRRGQQIGERGEPLGERGQPLACRGRDRRVQGAARAGSASACRAPGDFVLDVLHSETACTWPVSKRQTCWRTTRATECAKGLAEESRGVPRASPSLVKPRGAPWSLAECHRALRPNLTDLVKPRGALPSVVSALEPRGVLRSGASRSLTECCGASQETLDTGPSPARSIWCDLLDRCPHASGGPGCGVADRGGRVCSAAGDRRPVGWLCRLRTCREPLRQFAGDCSWIGVADWRPKQVAIDITGGKSGRLG